MILESLADRRDLTRLNSLGGLRETKLLDSQGGSTTEMPLDAELPQVMIRVPVAEHTPPARSQRAEEWM